MLTYQSFHIVFHAYKSLKEYYLDKSERLILEYVIYELNKNKMKSMHHKHKPSDIYATYKSFLIVLSSQQNGRNNF